MNNIEIFESTRSTGYDEFVETWIPNYHFFLDCLPKLLSETVNKNLLVVGCGTGNEITRFVEGIDPWSIAGIDPSPEMIKQAKDKLKRYTNVNLIDGLVSDLVDVKKYNLLHFY